MGIKELVQALGSSDVSEREAAVWRLSDPALRTGVCSAGVLDLLLALVRSGAVDPPRGLDAPNAAVAVLQALAGHDDGRLAVVGAGGVDALVKALGSRSRKA